MVALAQSGKHRQATRVTAPATAHRHSFDMVLQL
jgi:hypothetical protein